MAVGINTSYEVSSEGAVRHWEIPYARLTDTTPTETHAAQVTGRVPGLKLTGTVLTLDPAASIAVIDFTHSMVYRHDVRNVLTYSGAAEATFGVLAIGDPVYYDPSATMPAGVELSTSPLDATGAVNTLFGHIVPSDDPNLAAWPTTVATAATVANVPVMQEGA